MYGAFLESLGHIQNNIPYITDNFIKQDCMVLFLTSPAATMSLYQNVNKFLSYRTLQVAIKLYCQYVHKPSLTNRHSSVNQWTKNIENICQSVGEGLSVYTMYFFRFGWFLTVFEND